MTRIVPLFPLLIAAGILLAANGMIGTLIALRADHEGFAPIAIGLVSAAYFCGYLISAWLTPRLIAAVGHIRTFAGLSALAAVITLILAMVIDPWVWAAIRAVMGFCFAGLATTIESWLNARSTNEDRGRVLAVYRVLDIAAVTGGQFLLPVFPIGGFEIFSLVAIFYCLSLVPVALGDRSRPRPPERFRFEITAMWRISPLACMGCVAIGLTNSAFRLIGPLFAKESGLNVSGIAFFITAGIVGAAVSNIPFGWFSDRYGRRISVIIATIGATLAGFYLSLFARAPMEIYAGVFAFGAFALPLYSLSAAHANDQTDDDSYVLVAAGLSFFYSTGAIVGPLVAAIVIETFGPAAFFTYTSIVHSLLLVITLYRMYARRAPATGRTRFVSLLRTSPVFFRLARKSVRNPAPSRRQGGDESV